VRAYEYEGVRLGHVSSYAHAHDRGGRETGCARGHWHVVKSCADARNGWRCALLPGFQSQSQADVLRRHLWSHLDPHAMQYAS
jgi:hypothetical protein